MMVLSRSACRLPSIRRTWSGDAIGVDDAGADGIADVVVDVGNGVAEAANLRFEGDFSFGSGESGEGFRGPWSG